MADSPNRGPGAWAPPVAKLPTSSVRTQKSKCGYDDDPTVRAYYKRAEWTKLRALCKSLNGRCQYIGLDGEQCTQPSRIAHHLISPRVNPSRVYDWQNLVMVCESHHPDEAGEPLDTPATYAITIGILGATFDPNTLIAKLQEVGQRGMADKPGEYHTVESLLKRLKR